MTSIVVHGVQNIAGRRSEALRVFGVREHDAAGRLVEVHLPVKDVEDMLRAKGPITIEVPDESWAYVMSVVGLDVKEIT